MQLNKQTISFAVCVILLLLLDLRLGQFLNAEPSHQRNWKTPHGVLPSVTFIGNGFIVENIRNFSYNAEGDITDPSYETGRYEFDELTRLWYGAQPFAWDLFAHSFISFEFEDGRFLTLSVEARQTENESYGVIAGLLREFELIYIWGEERDIVGVRSHILKDDIFLYQIEAPLEDTKSYLRKILMRTNDIRATPAWYNTITENCTTSLFAMSGVPDLTRYTDYRVLFPGFAPRLLHKLGLIDNNEPLEDQMNRARIDPASARLDDPAFSQKIRAE